jgi:hypothetical protein
MRRFLSALAFASLAAACGKTGTVKFELALDNDNDRAIAIDNGGQADVFTVANVIVIVDKVILLQGNREVEILGKTPFRFDAAAEVEAEIEVEVGDFDGLKLVLGVADAATAADAGEENVFGRTFHIEGTFDSGLDGTQDGIVTYAPAAQELTFNVPFSVVANEEVVPEIIINLEALLAGVDYAAADVIDGELVISEESAVDQTGEVAAAVPASFEMIIE